MKEETIKEQTTKKSETYSTAIYLNYGFDVDIKPFLDSWKRNSHTEKDFYHVKMIQKNDRGENKLSHIQIDSGSKLYIDIHGMPGSSIAQTDRHELGFKTTLSYQDLAKGIIESLTQEQRDLLTQKESPTHLRIRFISCYSGEGTTLDGKDSFAAQFHRYLKEHYGIYSEVIGVINPTMPSRTGRITVKYGHEKEAELYQKQYNKISSELEREEEWIKYLNVQKIPIPDELKSKFEKLSSEFEKLTETLPNFCVRKQPGSTVLYKWDSNGEQIREDGQMGGIWRANVYQTLIHCIKTTKFPKKQDGLYTLLTELDTLPNEEAMLEHLKTALDHKGDPYGIKEGRSKILGFFDDRSDTYHKISTLIQEKEAVLIQTSQNVL